MHRYVMTVRCPDRPGIVHAFAEGLLNAGANILDNAQYSDPITGLFCIRTRFETELSDLDAIIGHAPAGFLRTLYRERRAKGLREVEWNQAAHDESLAVVAWVVAGLQSGMWEFLEVVPVGAAQGEVEVHMEQMRMM